MADEPKTDISTAVGIALALILVGVAMSLGGGILSFFDIKSLLIVLGGTTFLTIACFTAGDFFRSQILIFRTIFHNNEDPNKAAIAAIEIAEKARKEGILALEKYEDLVEHNKFLKRGIGYIVDGLPNEEIEKMLNEEISSMIERHNKGVGVLRKAAEISPAMGLIGTLIGLIQMLGNLDDPSSIGPAMAVALLTTFYGAALSYMVFTPLASKLETISSDEADIMDIYMLAIKSIGNKENPRRLEMLINSVLSPAERVQYFS
jgi:chemotaxis protein MotA